MVNNVLFDLSPNLQILLTVLFSDLGDEAVLRNTLDQSQNVKPLHPLQCMDRANLCDLPFPPTLNAPSGGGPWSTLFCEDPRFPRRWLPLDRGW